MKRSHGFLAILVLLSVSVCGLVYRAVDNSVEAPARSAPSSAKQPTGGGRTAEAAELGKSRWEMARFKRRISVQGQRLEAPDSVKAETQASATPQDPQTDPEERAEQERKYREYMADVDAGFRKEIQDPQWSSAAATVVQTALVADNDLRPLARDVECRAHSCRVEIADDGSGTLGKILPAFAQQVSQSLPSVTTDRIEDADGNVTIVLYLSRYEEATTMIP